MKKFWSFCGENYMYVNASNSNISRYTCFRNLIEIFVSPKSKEFAFSLSGELRIMNIHENEKKCNVLVHGQLAYYASLSVDFRQYLFISK